MPSKIGQYNFPKPGKVLPSGSKVKPQRIRPITQGVTVPPKPQKVAAVKPSKFPSAPKLKQPTVRYARTTRAR